METLSLLKKYTEPKNRWGSTVPYMLLVFSGESEFAFVQQQDCCKFRRL